MDPHSKRFAAVNYHAYLRGIIPGTAAMGSLDLVSKSDIKIQEQSYSSGKFGTAGSQGQVQHNSLSLHAYSFRNAVYFCSVLNLICYNYFSAFIIPNLHCNENKISQLTKWTLRYIPGGDSAGFFQGLL